MVVVLAVQLSTAAVRAGELIIADDFLAGSSGHELTVRVENLSETQPLEGVSVSLLELPGFVAVTAIRPGSLTLQPGESGTFSVVFSLREDAPDNATGRLAVQVSASSDTQFDVTRPTLIVTAKQPDEAQRAGDAIAACDFTAALQHIRELPEEDPRRAQLRTAFDEALLAHDQATAALDLASSRLEAGDVDGANAALERASVSDCPDIRDRIASLGPRIAEAGQDRGRDERAVAEAALGSCDYAAMRDARSQLAALDQPSSEDIALLDRLDQEIAADTAYTRSEVTYFSGNLQVTSELLAQARATSCPARQEAVADREAKVERLRDVLARVEATLAACDLAAMQDLSNRLDGRTHVLLIRAKGQLDGAVGPLSSAVRANDEAGPAYQSGRIDEAQGSLNRAIGALDGIGASACPDLRQTIAGRIDKIERLRAALARADRARQACDVPAMRAFIAQAQNQSHVLLTGKVAELREAIPGCTEETPVAEQEPPEQPEVPTGGEGRGGDEDGYLEATAQCRAEFGDQAYAVVQGGRTRCACDSQGTTCTTQTARQPESNATQPTQTNAQFCSSNYRGSVPRGTDADGSYRCGCPDGLYASESQAACIPWSEVVAQAEGGCRAEGMVLASVSGPDDYGCCPAGTVNYDEQRDICWTEDAMVADAQNQCARDGLIAAQINGPDDYICCPQGTTRYDAASNRCIDENAIARNNARQAAQAAQAIGQLLQGLSGAGGYSGGGYTGGGGYSGGGGHGDSPACPGLEQQLNQHSQRVAQLANRYRSNAAQKSKAQLQAEACDMFREYQNGQRILRQAQQNGCQIPPQAFMNANMLNQTVAQNC